MTTESVFVDVAQMEKMLAMGMAEGMTQAVDQIENSCRRGAVDRFSWV